VRNKGPIASVLLLTLYIGLAGATDNVAVPRTAVPRPLKAMRVNSIKIDSDGTRRYIIRLKDSPLATYSGGIQNLAATAPRAYGKRVLDIRSERSQAYLQYLNARQSAFLNSMTQTLGHTAKIHFKFRFAFNGFALRLTPAQAVRVASLPDVRYVRPDRAFRLAGGAVPIPGGSANTSSSRAWIGADSVWALPTFTTPGGYQDTEGEGIVVADLDTGINALNSSFADRGLDNYAITNPLGSGNYLGVCNSANTILLQSNTYDSSFPCNDKLIGAYTYTRYLANPSNDPNSPEDSEGHGSHTASTIAGDFTSATINGVTLPLSGVAPHANIIAYDVCDPTDLCYESASVAAIDQAILDQSTLEQADPTGFKGMVMNFSIGGSDDPYNDPVDYAFLAAESAGIFVSAAAGNGGPGGGNTVAQQYPVSHLAPWITTVGAATDDSDYVNGLQGFSGGTGAPTGPLTGTGFTQGYGPAQIVYAGNYPYTAAEDPTPTYSLQQDAAECLLSFATSTFPSGAIVVCDRGDIARVQKAINVQAGSAGGFVLADAASDGTDLENDAYAIPGVQLTYNDGKTLETWLNANIGTTLTATIAGVTVQTNSATADQVAGFSSRGPVNSVYDDILKPDLIAPGVNILAAYDDPKFDSFSPASTTSAPENFTFLDGTSMATPHDTGAAALLKEFHSSWDPMEIKSALMSTAISANLGDQCSVSGDCTVTTSSSPSPQVRGAGRISLRDAARAGFVLDESQADFNNAYPGQGGDPSALNLTSLANYKCVISCTWTRTLSATQTSSTLSYVVTVPVWMTVAIGTGAAGTSTTFTLAPGATAVLTFTANMATLSSSVWSYGEIDFTSSSSEDDGNTPPDQHFPVAVFNQLPAALMTVIPGALSQTLFVNGSTADQTISINNSGQVTLNWDLVSVLNTNSLISKTLTFLTPHISTQSTGIGNIVNRPFDGLAGSFADFFSVNGHGIYSADTFSMVIPGTLLTISTPGFVVGGAVGASLTDATSITWYIYPDNNGLPGGNPEDGMNDYAWTFSATPTSAGVDIGGNNIGLDITAAGAPPLQLKAGSYWLIVAVAFNSDITQSNAEFWAWGYSKEKGGNAKIIDPGDILKNGFIWYNNISSGSDQASMAFTLTGTFNCDQGVMPGIGMSASSGAVTPGSSDNVIMTFDPSGLSAGTYTGGLCITDNDPTTPFVILPITEIIKPNAPLVSSEQATNVTLSSATISALVTPGGDSASMVYVYGTSANNLNNSIATSNVSGLQAQQITATITGLACGTQYYFQGIATNSEGEGTGDVVSFTTEACPVPNIVSQDVTNISESTADLVVTIDPNGNGGALYFSYGTSATSLNESTSSQMLASTQTQTISIPVSGLLCGTQYYFSVVVTYAQSSVTGTIRSFSTNACASQSGGASGGNGSSSSSGGGGGGGGGGIEPLMLLMLLLGVTCRTRIRTR
jgi:hypothetical protein